MVVLEACNLQLRRLSVVVAICTRTCFIYFIFICMLYMMCCTTCYLVCVKTKDATY